MKKQLMGKAVLSCAVIAAASCLSACKKEVKSDHKILLTSVEPKQEGYYSNVKGRFIKAYYHGEPLMVEKLDENTYVLDGDVVLEKSDLSFSETTTQSTIEGRTWPNRIVYYSFGSNASSKLRSDWNTARGFYTTLGFEFRVATSGDYIQVVENSNGSAFSDAIGRKVGKQTISVDSRSFGAGSVAHEIGHAIGLPHEQKRPDRDLYINVNTSDYQWQLSTAAFGVGPFDFNSIMIYGSGGAATKKDGSTWSSQRSYLSDVDKLGINYHYSKTSHIATGTYEIKSYLNSLNNLDVSSSNNISAYSDNNGSNQRWQLSHVRDGYYKIINSSTGKSLDVTGAGTSAGTDVATYTYSGSDNQLWQIVPGHQTGSYRIFPKMPKIYVLISRVIALLPEQMFKYGR
jgi:hypothetical protein